MGFSPTSVMAQRIKAGTGALVAAPSVMAQASTINTTGVTYNPSTNQYHGGVAPDARRCRRRPGGRGRWNANRRRDAALDAGRHVRFAVGGRERGLGNSSARRARQVERRSRRRRNHGCWDSHHRRRGADSSRRWRQPRSEGLEQSDAARMARRRGEELRPDDCSAHQHGHRWEAGNRRRHHLLRHLLRHHHRW